MTTLHLFYLRATLYLYQIIHLILNWYQRHVIIVFTILQIIVCHNQTILEVMQIGDAYIL